MIAGFFLKVAEFSPEPIAVAVNNQATSRGTGNKVQPVAILLSALNLLNCATEKIQLAKRS
jgi:hypothetical protein